MSEHHHEATEAYENLRRGGAPAARASVELGLGESAARLQELLFRARAAAGRGDRLRPHFARHDAHVEAVRAAGGYPAIAP